MDYISDRAVFEICLNDGIVSKVSSYCSSLAGIRIRFRANKLSEFLDSSFASPNGYQNRP